MEVDVLLCNDISREMLADASVFTTFSLSLGLQYVV